MAKTDWWKNKTLLGHVEGDASSKRLIPYSDGDRLRDEDKEIVRWFVLDPSEKVEPESWVLFTIQIIKRIDEELNIYSATFDLFTILGGEAEYLKSAMKLLSENEIRESQFEIKDRELKEKESRIKTREQKFLEKKSQSDAEYNDFDKLLHQKESALEEREIALKDRERTLEQKAETFKPLIEFFRENEPDQPLQDHGTCQ